MIKGPPANMRKYVTVTRDRIVSLTERIRASATSASRFQADGEQLLFRFLTYGGIEPEEAMDIWEGARRSLRYIEGDLPWTARDVLNDINHVLAAGADNVGFLVRSARGAAGTDDWATKLSTILASAERGAEAYGYLPGDAGNDEDPEYVAAMRLFENLREASAAVSELQVVLLDLAEKAEAFVEAREMIRWKGKWRPEHGPVETLWHASAHARKLAEEGFSVRKPESRRGLGAFGYLPNVSMTHDRDLAENIAEVLREVWDIAHGKIGVSDIASRIKEEGIHIRFDLRIHIGTDDPHSLEGRDGALKLYWVYLGLSEKRDNPVIAEFGELADSLSSVAREDIGVVECMVELDGSEEYLVGECEFRVEPHKIRSVQLLGDIEPETPQFAPGF